MAEFLWDLRAVTLAGDGAPRLREIDLRIETGVTAVLGYSGAGKTSLLNLLVGFERPSAGRVEAQVAAGRTPLPVFWVPQNDGLWPHLTAREHLRAVGADAAVAEAMLAAFDLAGCGAARPERLSQGERARLSVARALAARPATLVMDEPLAHVDPARVGRYWEVIRTHVAQTGASLVFATHAPERVLAEAGHAVCLERGRLLHTGPVADLYWRPPTAQIAECLGPANWFEPADAALWLGQASFPPPRCCRPEQTRVDAATDGPATLLDARFGGSIAEATLRHDATGAVRRFFHRPCGPTLTPGLRVAVRVCLLLMLAALLTACGRGEAAALPVHAVHHYALPSDGTKSPSPRGLTAGPRDEIFVVDTAGRVLVFDAGGTLVRQWRMPESDKGRPESIMVLKDGRIAVPDTHYHRLVFFNADGTVQSIVGKEGTGPGEFVYPVSMTQDDAENLYVCEYGSNDRIQKFTRDGAFIASFGGYGTGEGQLQRPSGIVWRAGSLYVADAMNNRVQVFTDDGRWQRVLAKDGVLPAMNLPYDIALGAEASGSVVLVEYGGGRVLKLGLDGGVLGAYGSTGGGERQLSTPWGVAVDSRAHVWIADTGNRRLVELEP